MRASSFQGFFQPISYIAIGERSPESFRQQLAEVMTSQRSEILSAIRDSESIAQIFKELNKNDYGQYIENQYDNLLALLKEYDREEQKLPLWLKFYQKLQFDLPHDRIAEIAFLISGVVSSRLSLKDKDVFLGMLFLQELSYVSELVRQRYYISVSKQELVETIFNELRSMEWATEESVDMGTLQEECAALLDTWADTYPDGAIELELEFVALFLERLVAQFPMPYRFWEMLLLKIDNWCQVKSGKKPQHALTDSIEALLGASYRFDFIRDLCAELNDRYQSLGAPVGKMLLVMTALMSNGEGRLLHRCLRELEVDTWCAKLATPEKLSEHYHDAMASLLERWERAQTDWFSDAHKTFETFLRAPSQLEQLLAETATDREHFCALITEGLTDSAGPRWSGALLEGLISEAVNAVSLTDNMLLARELFRMRMAPRMDLDKDAVFWKKYREISRALQRFEPQAGAMKQLFEQLKPLYSSLDILVQDSLQSSFNWFGGGEILAQAKVADSGRALVTLQMLAFCRRSHQPRQALFALKSWYGLTFAAAHSREPEPSASTAGFRALARKLRETQGGHGGVKLLAGFVGALPAVLMAHRLMREASQIAVSAASQVAHQCPDFAKTVGKKGIQDGAGDNRYIMFKIAQIYASTHEEPRRQVLWWWNTSVAPYLVTFHRQAYTVNLRSLVDTLHEKLPAPEAELAAGAIQAIYLESFRITLEDSYGAESAGKQGAIVGFRDLHIKAPLWGRLLDIERPASAHFQHLANMLESWTGEASSQQMLSAFLQDLRRHGDPELAWEATREMFRADVQALGTRVVEQRWRILLGQMPTYLGAEVASFWTQLLTHGVTLIRQIGLAEVLSARREVVFAEFSTRLGQTLGEADLEEHLHNFKLASLMDRLQRTWREQSPGMAALNLSRYVVEVMAAQVKFSTQEWHVLWFCLEEALSTYLDAAEQLGLHQWVTQLDSLSAHLPGISPLSREVFLATEEVLAETRTAEQHWRQCLGGLLAAAATPLNAPVSGRYLAQRLVLSCPVFKDETVESWQQRQMQLGEAFPEVFSGAVGRMLAERHGEIRRALAAVSQLEQAHRLHSMDVYYVMLGGAGDTQQLWQLDMAVRQVTGGENVPTPADLLVAQLNDWRVPESQMLSAQLHQHGEACQLPDAIKVQLKRWGGLSSTTLSLNNEQSSELRLLIRLMSLSQSLGDAVNHTPQFRRWLFETLILNFDEFDSEQQSALFGGLRKTLIDHQGGENALSLEWQKLCDQLQHSSFAVRLSRDAESLAKTVVDNQRNTLLKKAGSRNIEEECTMLVKHLRSLLRHLGYHLGGMSDQEKMVDWYCRRIGEYLPTELKELEVLLFTNTPHALQKLLNSAELALLDRPVKEICQALGSQRGQNMLVETHENS